MDLKVTTLVSLVASSLGLVLACASTEADERAGDDHLSDSIDSDCPTTIEEYCREYNCPTSIDAANRPDTRWPRVFQRSDDVVIASHFDGTGDIYYFHFESKNLVGVSFRSDVAAHPPVSCRVIGREVITPEDLCEFGDTGNCVDSCTFGTETDRHPACQESAGDNSALGGAEGD